MFVTIAYKRIKNKKWSEMGYEENDFIFGGFDVVLQPVRYRVC